MHGIQNHKTKESGNSSDISPLSIYENEVFGKIVNNRVSLLKKYINAAKYKETKEE
jgi:hypothetical protein